MITGLVATLGPWTWWVIAVLLAAVEIVAPGTFFIWFAAAAAVVGTIALVVEMPWQAELALFVGLALVAALAGRRFYGRARGEGAASHLNDRLGRQIGRTAVLERGISNGAGHARLGDTVWLVEGPDLPAGTSVRITGHRNGRLTVVAAADADTDR